MLFFFFAVSVKGWILHHCLSTGLLLQAMLSGVVLLKHRWEEWVDGGSADADFLRTKNINQETKTKEVKVFASVLP